MRNWDSQSLTKKIYPESTITRETWDNHAGAEHQKSLRHLRDDAGQAQHRTVPSGVLVPSPVSV